NFNTSGLALTSTDSVTNDLTSDQHGAGIFKASGTGNGYRIIVPSSPYITQRLKVYSGQFSCVVTGNAQLLQSGGTLQQTTRDSGAAASLNSIWTIDFIGSGMLAVWFTITTNRGSTPNISNLAVTLTTP